MQHAAWSQNREINIHWLDSDKYEKNKSSLKELNKMDGVIVPGGFGKRGTEGMIAAANYTRKKNIPYLGLCLGMQILTVEFARNVCGLKKANSEELNPKTPHPVIHIMEEQKKLMKDKKYGATMRLGAYDCKLRKNSLAKKLYGQAKISERHRHRFEFNNDYKKKMEEAGLVASGINPQRNLVEIVELPKHKFYIGCQFHPEFKSRPLSPHPLFVGLIKASIKK